MSRKGPIANLDWPTALRQARGGFRIRRSVWDVPVLMRADGALEFEYVAKGLGKSYEPTPTDRKATDWIAI